ncbi:hypothetical protein M1N82_00340 [Dehalococcoidia bacterium]|nr:hypothetical protein [Dehalococcoidia bacterium]MCL0048147.1 hypothetical protein [Dehalococcoidia bacterium]MCL0077345.1 hypothetical protein [Dehalococcoidia bacterium]MCL0083998.1 hypothetical protein [Dehalococcoidia bacterium]MCL0092080.1 hypothetical protein [Dehalococcoidia bacterium]
MSAVCRFTFPDATDRFRIEAAIASAIFNAECCFGKPRVRLSAGYYMAEDKPQCIIDVSTEVGEHIAQVFTGIMMNTLGEDEFQVRRIEGPPSVAQKTASE